MKDRKKFATDTGRVVYGGGGIMPDVIVHPAPLSRATQLLEVRGTMFNFGVEYVAKHADINARTFAITPALIEDFTRYAIDKEIAPAADIREVLTKPNDRKYIERVLKAEIVAAQAGYDASYPFRLQGDAQVEKALSMFPEAQKLAMKAAELRGHEGQQGKGEAGNRAAQASPHS
jgi:hypothetical protein